MAYTTTKLGNLRRVGLYILMLAVMCGLVVQVDAQRGGGKKDVGQIKLDKMRSLRDKASDGIIVFNSEMYK